MSRSREPEASMAFMKRFGIGHQPAQYIELRQLEEDDDADDNDHNDHNNDDDDDEANKANGDGGGGGADKGAKGDSGAAAEGGSKGAHAKDNNNKARIHNNASSSTSTTNDKHTRTTSQEGAVASNGGQTQATTNAGATDVPLSEGAAVAMDGSGVDGAEPSIMTPWRRAWRAVLWTLLWYAFSMSLSLYNKNLLGSGPTYMQFGYPLTMTAMHFMAQFLQAALCLWLVWPHLRPKLNVSWRKYAKFVFIPALATALDIGLSNLSLVYISLSFYTMCKSVTPVFLLSFAFMFGLEKPSYQLVFIVFVISSGLALTVYGETMFDARGFAAVTCAAVMSGLRWTMVQVSIFANEREKKKKDKSKQINGKKKQKKMNKQIIHKKNNQRRTFPILCFFRHNVLFCCCFSSIFSFLFFCLCSISVFFSLSFFSFSFFSSFVFLSFYSIFSFFYFSIHFMSSFFDFSFFSFCGLCCLTGFFFCY